MNAEQIQEQVAASDFQTKGHLINGPRGETLFPSVAEECA
jgi:hypothetical protein